MTGFSKMLLNTVGNKPLDDLQKEDLTTVYRSSMRALSVMNGMIDIARFNRGEKELAHSKFALQTLLDQGQTQWKKYHPGSDLQLAARILAKTEYCTGDELLLQQLIAFAISFVGAFCESRAVVTITVEDEPGSLLFTFSGVGLKLENISALDREMLGYIINTILGLHGGHIRRAEENDSGALLQFDLPLD
jgi:K+-sensing histidine kinase KdpD